MSRQNKVNPGTYTQRGRLSQDDAARELARQRAIGSPEPWPPEQRHPFQALEALKQDDTADGEESPEPVEPVKKRKKPAPVKAKTARKTARSTTAKAAGKRKTIKAKTVKAKTVRRATSARRTTSAKRAKP